jgi:hypothetical protein
MNTAVRANGITTISAPAARVAIAAALAVVLLLAGLHVLSPEFDPSWRVVSEYANGKYGWVLSLMFASWALSSWSLVIALWPQVHGIGGKIGLILLIVAGAGQAMGGLFDINHPLHGLAGMLGVPTFPVAALLISVRLGRTQGWSAAKCLLLGTANLTWVSLVLMIVAFIMMTSGRTHADAESTSHAIAWIGWANRFLVVAYCLWEVTVASLALRWRPQSQQR